jgi:hypothetical protein
VVLGGFGWFWVVLGGFGWFWVVLGGFGWFWTIVVGILMTWNATTWIEEKKWPLLHNGVVFDWVTASY